MNTQAIQLPSCELAIKATGKAIIARESYRRQLRNLGAFVAAVMISLAPLAWAHGDDSSAVRPQDEIWLVSSRHVGCLQSGDVPELETKRYTAETGWVEADVSDLFQPASPDQIVVMYVHGNRVESNQAAYEGRCVYSLITSGIDISVPIRFIAWSWPSAQVRGQLRDVRVKAQRTELGGYCLGWFLAQLPEQQRVSILSYSFGVRIATGALHLVGGGQLGGRVLPPLDRPGPQARMVALAAALHRNWLRPGGYHEMAFSHLDFLLNLFNCCDPVLKRYPFLYKGSHAQALGYTGMYTGDLGEIGERIEQRNVSNTVQKSHTAIHYFENCQLKARMQQILFWNRK